MHQIFALLKRHKCPKLFVGVLLHLHTHTARVTRTIHSHNATLRALLAHHNYAHIFRTRNTTQHVHARHCGMHTCAANVGVCSANCACVYGRAHTRTHTHAKDVTTCKTRPPFFHDIQHCTLCFDCVQVLHKFQKFV